jgi:uncharacterized protein YodC (DUF2158 family)
MAEKGTVSVGDVVTLNSGGPMLNVTGVKDINGEEHCEVKWLGEKNAPHSTMFPTACLRREARGSKQSG